MVKSESPNGPKKALGAKAVEQPLTTFELKGKELLTYFANLSEDDRKGILSQLRDNNNGDTFALDLSQPAASDDNKEPYKDIGLHRKKMVTSQELKSGLQISLAPRNSKDLGTVNVILHKQDRGNNVIGCKKT